ncbi:MAG: hypothetical protein AAF725_17490 [Acidobacteriota bacterium]
MKPSPHRFFPLLLAALLAQPAFAGGELEVRWWAPDLSSTVTADGAGFDPDVILPNSLDLGLDAEEDFEGRLTLRASFGLFVRGAYQNISSDGSTRLDIGVVGLPFDVTADIGTGIDFEYARLSIGWMFGAQGPITFALFGEAKAVRGDASISASAFGLSAGLSEDFEAAVPAAGAMLRLRAGANLEVFAEVSVAVDTDEADVLDYEAGVRLFLGQSLGVGAGYRVLEIDGTFDSVEVDYQLEGPFANALLRW